MNYVRNNQPITQFIQEVIGLKVNVPISGSVQRVNQLRQRIICLSTSLFEVINVSRVAHQCPFSTFFFQIVDIFLSLASKCSCSSSVITTGSNEVPVGNER